MRRRPTQRRGILDDLEEQKESSPPARMPPAAASVNMSSPESSVGPRRARGTRRRPDDGDEEFMDLDDSF